MTATQGTARRDGEAFGKPLEELRKPREDVVGCAACSIRRVRNCSATFHRGPQPAYADYILLSHCQWARIGQPAADLEADDALAAWRDACSISTAASGV